MPQHHTSLIAMLVFGFVLAFGLGALANRLRLSPLHRYVRHPWYSRGLVSLWTRNMDEARLGSRLCITLYLWLGSLREERKLLAFHGEAYAAYRRRVAGLLPWPGRILGREEARDLEARAGTAAGSDTRPRPRD